MRPYRLSRSLLVSLAAAILLASHVALGLWAARGKGTTGDELLHLTAGFTFWKFHDYRLHPENGILPQRWAALPAYLMQAPFPPLEGNHSWRTSGVQPLGHEFLYETGHDHFPMLMAGRAMIMVFSLATGVLVFCWSRRLFGDAGALLSTTLFAFSPHFLAHGALVTSDACMTFFFLASCGAWWRHLHRPNGGAWILSAIVFGFACVAKHSAVLLLPMMVLMALVRAFAAEPLQLLGRTFTTWRGKMGGAAISAIGHAAVGTTIIWACYGFRYEAFNAALPAAAHFLRPWEILDLHIGTIGKIIRFLAALHILPEAFLYGTAYVVETAQIRSAFLNGNYSTTGWVSFFPWAFALKSTLAALAGTTLVVLLALHRWAKDRMAIRRDLYVIAPLLILFAVYWAFSLTSNLNIGHRHILPTYPVLFIAIGALASWLNRRTGLIMAVLLASTQVIEAARIAPHFLTYFNPISGGPTNGHYHLVDSSLDWGQDLPALKKWLESNAPTARPYLSYFGTDEPDYHRIPAFRLPFVNGFQITYPLVALKPGIYCVSATMLQHVYSPVRGPWTLELEKEYQQARATEPMLLDYESDTSKRAELLKIAPEQNWKVARTRYELLRFARLCHYLRVRSPNAVIGNSILIFDLEEHEIKAAVGGAFSEWRQLIEQAK